MANCPRTAKSGSDWTDAELHAYNIIVEYQDAATFFGVNPLPQPAVAGELLNHLTADEMVLRYMDMAMNRVPESESAVADFAVHLLSLLGYVPRARMARTHADIPFTICGQYCHVATDLSIVDAGEIILLVQEDKRHLRPLTSDPEIQLIAKAIAAFQANNLRQRQVLGQDPLTHIPVTTELSMSVVTGTYPATPTIVHAHIPALARPARRLIEGMKPLDNRANILACFETFKIFVE
ncbi:hypothetical protein V8E53_008956 [Lactarius tabidus]